MDSGITTAAATAASSSQVDTSSYQWMGRNQAEFWADQAKQAKANGTDNVSLSFKDALDLVNPLQHIPVISDIYQAITGDDSMKPAVKTVGDGVYGGPLGAVSSVFDDIFKQASGKDITDTIASWLGIGGGDAPAEVATAAPTTIPGAAIPTAAIPATATATAADSDMKASDIVWNQPGQKPFAKFATTTLPAGAASTTANAAPAGAVNPLVPNSQLFANLQKGAAPQGQVISSTAQKFFNPNAQRFAGIQPASLKTSAANGNITGDAASSFQTEVNAQAAAASNAAITGQSAAGVPTKGDTVQNPQSEFAQKMMAALDRYQATQKAGGSTTPTVSAGL